ncbi:MAG: hypothetical protein ACRCX8_06415 [Sarcina sp.]
MITVNEIAKSLNIKPSDIHNRLRKKKYQQHITKESKEKFLSKEGYDLLKEELKEFENIENLKEEYVTIIEADNIQTNNIDISILLKTIEQQQETIKELTNVITQNNNNLRREQLQNLSLLEVQKVEQKQHEREITRIDSLLLEKKRELIERQAMFQNKEKKSWSKFWKKF